MLRRRSDGWPICPICDEDELGDLSTGPADPSADLFCYRCGRVTVSSGAPVEFDPTAGLPADLVTLLRDPSIVIPQDQAVFEMIAKWSNAPSNTASA